MDSHSSSAAARLLAVNGEAWLRQGGEHLPLATGNALAAGDVLETGAATTVQLQLASGHVLALGPEQFLSLDADVLATAAADPGEWCCSAPEGLDLLLGGAALSLDSVLEPAHNLDHLLGGAAAPAAADHPGLALLDDPGLHHLLRSLFGPEAH